MDAFSPLEEWGHRWTLRFPHPVEAEFRGIRIDNSIGQVRAALLLGLILYGRYGILDLIVVPDAIQEVYFIRYVIVCPTIVLGLGLLSIPSFRRHGYLIGGSIVALAGVGVIGMLIASSSSASDAYYAGLILVIMYGYTFLRLPFLYATSICCCLVIAYEIAAVFIEPTPRITLINNSFFFVGANVIGMVASYHLERFERRNYLQGRLIEHQTEAILTEQQRAEQLLFQVLPESVARRVRLAEEPVADSFADVSVLFADITGFSALTPQLSPRQLIGMLNNVFFGI